MNESEILYRFSKAQATAEGLGLRLVATRYDLELRDVTNAQAQYARCASLDEVEQVLARRRAERPADGEASLY